MSTSVFINIPSVYLLIRDLRNKDEKKGNKQSSARWMPAQWNLHKYLVRSFLKRLVNALYFWTTLVLLYKTPLFLSSAFKVFVWYLQISDENAEKCKISTKTLKADDENYVVLYYSCCFIIFLWDGANLLIECQYQ